MAEKMKWWAFFFICVIYALFLRPETAALCIEETDSYILADLTYEVFDNYSRVIIVSNSRLDYITYDMEDPYRIVIDPVGVYFCELEEHINLSAGVVASVDVVKMDDARYPEGLDKFFYAVDSITLTLKEPLLYRINESEDGKVLIIDIGIKVEDIFSESKSIDITRAGSSKTDLQLQPTTVISSKTEAGNYHNISEPVIDTLYYEIMENSSLVIIAATKQIDFFVSTRSYPSYGLLLQPKGRCFTELEEGISVNSGMVKAIKIIKDESKEISSHKDYRYPIKYILVEPVNGADFDFYSNDDNTVWIIEFPCENAEKAADSPKIEEVVEITPPVTKEELTEETVCVQQEGIQQEDIIFEKQKRLIEQRIALEKEEILRQLKDEIKQEEADKEEQIRKARKIEEEKRAIEAEYMAKSIGKEILDDIIIKGKGLLGLEQAQSISIENSPMAKTAKDEMRLAQVKKNEAFRALLPQLKAKATHTTGDVVGVDFTEELYGLEAEQPIYQGRRLLNAYMQSETNYKISKARFEKMKVDSDLKVAEAYYSAITAAMNIRIQKDLLDNAEKVLEIAQKRHSAGLSTALEMLNVKSQYNQIKFQIASAERDSALASFKLKQAMNLDISEKGIDLKEIDTELDFVVIDIDLNKCLELALENQPDIIVNKLLVESEEFDQKIAKGKGDFKVDLTGFYGRSGSHYETEDLKLDQDWNIGLKVTKPFWGNTASYSFTKEQTNRKVGQTDRTGSVSHVGEFAILDSLSVETEIIEANVNKQKAENDLIETNRQIALEAKEAYYNYQESIIQVKNSLEKVKFQEEAVKVARMQAELNEALQSQFLETLVKYSDERSIYVKALSDYNLSLAKLNKAVGIPGYYSLDKSS